MLSHVARFGLKPSQKDVEICGDLSRGRDFAVRVRKRPPLANVVFETLESGGPVGAYPGETIGAPHMAPPLVDESEPFKATLS